MWRTVTVFVVAVVNNASGIRIGSTVATRIAGGNSCGCLGFGWGTGIGACARAVCGGIPGINGGINRLRIPLSYLLVPFLLSLLFLHAGKPLARNLLR